MEQLIKKESQKLINAKMREARIQRQIQVRQQAMAWTESTRKKFEEAKEKGIKFLADKVSQQVTNAAFENIQLLTRQNDLALAEIGMAHRAAAGMQQVERVKSLKRLKNREVAKNRGAAALATHLRAKQSESARCLTIIRRKEEVRKAEDAKSKELISRMPLVPTNSKVETQSKQIHPPNYQQSLAKTLRTSQSAGVSRRPSKARVSFSQDSSQKLSHQIIKVTAPSSSSLEFQSKNLPASKETGFIKMARIRTTTAVDTPKRSSLESGYKNALAGRHLREGYMKAINPSANENDPSSSYVRYFDAALPRGESKFIAPPGLAIKEVRRSPDAWEKGKNILQENEDEEAKKAQREEEMRRRAEERGKLAITKAKLEKNLKEVQTELLRQFDELDVDILGNKSQEAYLGLTETGSEDMQLLPSRPRQGQESDDEFSVVGTDEEFDLPNSPPQPSTMKKYLVTQDKIDSHIVIVPDGDNSTPGSGSEEAEVVDVKLPPNLDSYSSYSSSSVHSIGSIDFDSPKKERNKPEKMVVDVDIPPIDVKVKEKSSKKTTKKDKTKRGPISKDSILVATSPTKSIIEEKRGTKQIPKSQQGGKGSTSSVKTGDGPPSSPKKRPRETETDQKVQKSKTETSNKKREHKKSEKSSTESVSFNDTGSSIVGAAGGGETSHSSKSSKRSSTGTGSTHSSRSTVAQINIRTGTTPTSQNETGTSSAGTDASYSSGGSSSSKQKRSERGEGVPKNKFYDSTSDSRRTSSGSTVAEIKIRTTSTESVATEKTKVATLEELRSVAEEQEKLLRGTAIAGPSGFSYSRGGSDSTKTSYKEDSGASDYQNVTLDSTIRSRKEDNNESSSFQNGSNNTSDSRSSGETPVLVTLKVRKSKDSSSQEASDSANSSKSTDYYTLPEGPFTSTPDGKLKPKRERRSGRDSDTEGGDHLRKRALNQYVKKVLSRHRTSIDQMQMSSSSSSVVRMDAELLSSDSIAMNDSSNSSLENKSTSSQSSGRNSKNNSSNSSDGMNVSYRNPNALPTLSEETSEFESGSTVAETAVVAGTRTGTTEVRETRPQTSLRNISSGSGGRSSKDSGGESSARSGPDKEIKRVEFLEDITPVKLVDTPPRHFSTTNVRNEMDQLAAIFGNLIGKWSQIKIDPPPSENSFI